ncbi:MAG TPA: heme ABC transporter ATP-binding protein [Kiloniellales bacterium]|nr:heme ABC transporter ATP-binding protein [Kiloniellales bacterium]
MIRLRNVSLARGGRTILAGLDLTLESGEMAVLLGPNGAGKSTLLAALSGELAPGGGEVLFEGRPVGDWPARALAQRRAVLPQASRLQFGFTVAEVVELGRSPHAGTAEARHDKRAVAAALQAAGVSRFLRQDYRRLSGGEQQRVQLARTLAQIWRAEPLGPSRWLLLDEPVTSLDLAFQEQALEAAKAEARRGAGVIASLHDPNLAARHADRVLLIAGGKLVADGPPAEVLRPEVLSPIYGLRLAAVKHPTRDLQMVVPV